MISGWAGRLKLEEVDMGKVEGMNMIKNCMHFSKN